MIEILPLLFLKVIQKLFHNNHYYMKRLDLHCYTVDWVKGGLNCLSIILKIICTPALGDIFCCNILFRPAFYLLIDIQ